MTSRDPLGLTEQQRRVSDMSEAHGPLLGSMLAEPWREAYFETRAPIACSLCRCIVGHANGCLADPANKIIEGEWFA